MVIKRRHILISLSVFLLLLILGSFFDQQLSKSVFSDASVLATVVSTFGITPMFVSMSFCAGAIAITAIRMNYGKIRKIIYLVFSFAVFTLFVLLFISAVKVDKLYQNVGFKVFVIIMDAIFNGAGFALGIIYFNKRSDESLIWKMLFILAAITIGYGVVTLIKTGVKRPRFRFLQTSDFFQAGVFFRNWWESFKVTDSIKALPSYTKDAFRSFPSGHEFASLTLTSTAVYMPFVIKSEKVKKLQTPLFYIGLGWGLLIGWCRIVLGDHFLSDIAMSGLILGAFQLFLPNVLNLLYKKEAIALSKKQNN